jgi:hypothetical protein
MHTEFKPGDIVRVTHMHPSTGKRIENIWEYTGVGYLPVAGMQLEFKERNGLPVGVPFKLNPSMEVLF